MTRKQLTQMLLLMAAMAAASSCVTRCVRPGPTPAGPDGGVSVADAGPDWIDPWADAGTDALPTACELGCAQLARLGCIEGEFTGCATLADQVNAERMTVMPCACWALARTVAEARACGNLTCPGGAP